jgi:hypothetical protein
MKRKAADMKPTPHRTPRISLLFSASYSTISQTTGPAPNIYIFSQLYFSVAPKYKEGKGGGGEVQQQ